MGLIKSAEFDWNKFLNKPSRGERRRIENMMRKRMKKALQKEFKDNPAKYRQALKGQEVQA